MMVEYEEDLEDDIVSESAEYSPKSEFSKAMHVSEAVKLVRENRSKEMKAGYMNSILDREGNEVKTWVADTRKIYVASVDALRGLLTPERRRSERLKKIDKKFDEDKKKLWNKYAYEDFEIQRIPELNNSGAKYKIIMKGTKFLPEIDDELKTKSIKNNSPIYERGYWNNKVKGYWIEILELYDKYFEELNVLIDDLGYFKSTINF